MLYIGWRWGNQKIFTVKPLYIHMENRIYGPYMKHIWKGRVPPKIKMFMWFLENNVLLTKDNLQKGTGVVILPAPSVINLNQLITSFCNQFESIDHLFLVRC